MNDPVVSGKRLIALMLFSLLVLGLLVVVEINKSGTRVVFCDVGQGNGTYIRMESGMNILVDTGPKDMSMLACLGRHMPFFDRKLGYVIISHPQADHDGGLAEILKRYEVNTVVFSDAFRNDVRVQSFKSMSKTARFIFIKNQSEVDFYDGIKLKFITTAVNIKSASDDNDKSLIVSFETLRHRFLITGDISSAILSKISVANNRSLVLEVPHHGSSNGLSDRFLKLARPALAVISVGKKNPYGHPAAHTMRLLEQYRIPYKRTDLVGDIVMTE